MDFKEELHYPGTWRDLRNRLVICCLIVGVGFVVSYFCSRQIFELLIKPWVNSMPAGQPAKLIYTAPHEAFFVYMKVSFIAATIIATPLVLCQIWRFVVPDLYKNEKLLVIYSSSLCFVSGILFGYFIVIPAALPPATNYFTPMLRATEYLSFVNKILLCFGLVLQLPLFAFFLARNATISRQLRGSEKTLPPEITKK